MQIVICEVIWNVPYQAESQGNKNSNKDFSLTAMTKYFSSCYVDLTLVLINRGGAVNLAHD